VFQDHPIPNSGSNQTSSRQPDDLAGIPLSALEGLNAKELLRRGNLRVEKCELKDAGLYFELALDRAKQQRDFRGMSDSLAHLLRHSSEIGDETATQKWVSELEIFLAQNEDKLTPQVWYCKGIVAYRSSLYKKAQVLFHRFWREVEAEENSTTQMSPDTYREFMRSKAQALLALAVVAQAQGKMQRARYLCEVILKYAERERPRGILASTYLMLCRIAEKSGDLVLAKKWLQKAFAESVSEHNWYHYLYVLYSFAVISRLEQDFVQARFYLDLLEKAVVQEELRNLRQGILEERVKLNLNRVDLEIDLNRSVIRTREGEINLRRQHLLIEILHQLAAAHGRNDEESKQGLAKSEIIEKVWGESYNPEAHDGKLYYNINRIRKLIEPDQKKPQYLLNWRQGYRLAPELKIRVIQGENQA
jgi:DNA-binding winged helix-turn-helix (wHTH) protein